MRLFSGFALVSAVKSLLTAPYEMLRLPFRFAGYLRNNPALFINLIVLLGAPGVEADTRLRVRLNPAEDIHRRILAKLVCKDKTQAIDKDDFIIARHDPLQACESNSEDSCKEIVVPIGHFPEQDFYCQNGDLVWNGKDDGVPMPAYWMELGAGNVYDSPKQKL